VSPPLNIPGEQEVSIALRQGPLLQGQLGLIAGPGLVLCHPHPLYGGDMDNPVVVRAAEVAREEGLSTLRFNFRGVGRSTGIHGHGEGEQEDLTAALGWLHSRLPVGSRLGVAGYSFGAWVAARAAESGVVLAGVGLIAPPLAMLEFGSLTSSGRDVLLVAGTRDPYCPLDRLQELASRVPGAHTRTIDGADHFFFGKLFPLGEAIREWARRWA
jgi:alpha/beta superfamily hydrolase